jgi:glycosyltransferase involved in cell wall biosynthesis
MPGFMPPRRLLFLVTEDWYFVSHRLPMARAAQAAGFEVHVVTRVDRHGRQIEAEGFHLHPLQWRRGSANPIGFLLALYRIRSLYRRLDPDIVHHVAMQPSIMGSLAALGLPPARLNAMAGFGFAFTSKTLRARLVRTVLSALIRRLFNRHGSMLLVQNPDDRADAIALGLDASRIALIPGSGVDVEAFTPLPEPDEPITAAYVGRLLADKGLDALLAAHELLQKRGLSIRLLLAGEPDPANPASIPRSALEAWKRRPGVSVLGHVADIRTVWAKAHIAVLPSRREGLPMSLLEAAACGRPLVATDVPGCREIARDGINAILVPVDDPRALADGIERLATDRALRAHYGARSRQLVEAEFASTLIGREIVALYRQLLDSSPNENLPR